MRASWILLSAATAAVLACEGASSRAPASPPESTETATPDKQAEPRSANPGGANSATGRDRGATEAVRFAGEATAEREELDGGPQPLGRSPSPKGQLSLEIRDDAVSGQLTVDGLALEVKGNGIGNKIRAWLRSPGSGPRTEGLLLGTRSGSTIEGTFRVSGREGDRVHAGRFTVQAQ